MAARTASTPGGFNEAGARTPRMDLGYLRADRWVSGASMRPRCERPGWAGVTDAQPQSTDRASMRPGRERTGWAGVTDAQPQSTYRASMRPGRERPGWHRSVNTQSQWSRASMRPGRERPGWREDGIMRDFTIARFNEAGARTPRMAPLAAGSPLSSFTLQ